MEIIRVENEDLKVIEANRKRLFRTVSQPLNAQTIWDDICVNQRQRVIIICNTVSLTQGIYRDLQSLQQNLDLDSDLDFSLNINITLLHSRFLPEHRAQKELYLQDKFAYNWQQYNDNTCEVLISTQVVEAGINITSQVLYSQLCPMNSLLQRAGRCARFSGEIGEVLIYKTVEINQENQELAHTDLFDWEKSASDNGVENIQEPKQSYLPYKKDLCEQTWEVLQTHTNSEKANLNVGFRTEEEWINQVHQQEDLLNLKIRDINRIEFENKYEAAIFYGDESQARELIRKVDNRNIFTWEQSGFIDLSDDDDINPQELLPFSVPISTLCKAWRDFKESSKFGNDWIFKQIALPKNKSETYAQPVVNPINSRDFLVSCYRILVNPRFISYDEEIGLQIGIDIIGNGFKSPQKTNKITTSQYRYRMDNYVGHLALMWKSWRDNFTSDILKNGQSISVTYPSVRNELLVAGGKFIQTKIFPQAEPNQTQALFEILVFLAIFTHDLGKLQTKWQQVMRGWQQISYQQFNGKNPRKYLLAHTDYNPQDDQQKAALKAYENKNKRPNHAVESAFLAKGILQQSLIPLLKENFTEDTEQIKHLCYVIIMAAGRHHSAWANGFNTKAVAKLKQIELCPESQKVVADSWRVMMRFLPDTLPLTPANLNKNIYKIKELDLNQFNYDEIEFLQLYSLVIRALRLCDQRAVQLI